MEQIDCIAEMRDKAGPLPTIGSHEWMIAVSRILGVYDAQGHGPDLGSEEWRRALHRKAFGNAPPTALGVTYVSDTGERLHATFDNLKHNVTLNRAGRTVMLLIAVSASGAKYTANDEEVFWSKGARVTYWRNGKLVFQGVEETGGAEPCAPTDAGKSRY